jgi:hypothetical protein
MLGVAAMAVVLAGSATAKTATKHVPQAQHAASVAPGKRPPLLSFSPNALPPKYIVVNSGSLTSPANMQVHGSVSCPAKTVTYGGGVIVQSNSTGVNINSSYPQSTAWAADINNATASPTTFFVYAVCAKKNASWVLVSGNSTPNAAGVQTHSTATCPAGDKILSGGGFSDTLNTAVNENSTYPTKSGKGQTAVYGWAVDQNNGSTGAANVRVSAVCGHAAGYKEVIAAATAHPARTQTGGTARCPTGKVPLGGGVLSSSTSTLVNVNSSVPVDVGWTVFENNASASAATFTAFVICAGT